MKESRKRLIELGLSGLAALAISSYIIPEKKEFIGPPIPPSYYLEEGPMCTQTPSPEPTTHPIPPIRYSSKDEILLTKLIYGEARGIPFFHQAAVAHSALNRVLDERWPDSLEEVILQKTKDKEGRKIHQYSCFHREDVNYSKVRRDPEDLGIIEKKAWDKAFEIAKGVLEGRIKDPTNGATSYRDSSSSQYKWFVERYKGEIIIVPTGRTSKQGATHIAYARE